MTVKRVVGSALAIALLVGAAAVAFVYFTPVPRTIMCDGTFPRWMLQAQDYDGGGCAEVLPSSAAPPNADWTMICTGMCLDADQPPVWP